MAERPILFSAPMVRAILAGTKTQTRRVVKLDGYEGGEWYETRDGDHVPVVTLCPHGQPGDRLWVRETWADFCPMWQGRWCGHGNEAGKASDHEVYFRADDPAAWKRGAPKKWRPSIFMPRWASRIALKLTAVRVQRVQEIGEEDALAEGVDRTNTSLRGYAIERFKRLWDSINGKRSGCSWGDNPWVWALTFERMEVPRG